jgi:2-C-methyl-D-erythritol 4-phosphate cytidylyltransferase
VSQELLDRIVDTLSSCDACLPMVRCKDTIKRVVDGKVVNTLKREELYQAQTPQSFKTALIIKAHDYAKVHQVSVTDDASMVEIMGENVYVVEGDYDNIKITTKEDLR